MTSTVLVLRSSRTSLCRSSAALRGAFTTTSSLSMEPSFSSGSEPTALQPILDELTADKAAHKWHLSPAGDAISRPFKFQTFKAAWAFMNDTAARCKKERHHPEWSNVYNRVFVRWTTHNPPGLSEKDLNMAKVCDELAAREESKEMDEEPDAEELKRLADGVAGFAGDCCAPGTSNGSGSKKS